MFSRLLFVMLISVFFLLGIISACSKSFGAEDSDKDDILHLWRSCFDFLMLALVSMPSYKLIQALSTPVILQEDAGFIKRMKIGLFILCFLYLSCTIFYMLKYFHKNPLYTVLTDNIIKANHNLLDFKHRYIYFLIEIFLNCDIVVILIFGVKLIRQHDLSFVEDNFETQIRSEADTNPGV